MVGAGRVLFHNCGQSFSLQSGRPKEVGPGKRPVHTVVLDIVKKLIVERRGFEVQLPRLPIGRARAMRNDWEHAVLAGGSSLCKDGVA